jgi:hypothetical protein
MVVPFAWWPESFVRADFHATVKHYVERIRTVEEHFGWKVSNRVMDSAGKGTNADKDTDLRRADSSGVFQRGSSQQGKQEQIRGDIDNGAAYHD